VSRGHTIDPRRRKILEAANTLAATRRYRNQLVQLRAEARDKLDSIDKLIRRITEKLEQHQDV
jgi:hypothetical protein